MNNSLADSQQIFSDRLQNSISRSKSLLIAGLDPILDVFPEFILKEASTKCLSDSEALVYALKNFYITAIFSLQNKIAAIKPNIAFFEQYGIPGLRALTFICDEARNFDLPIILDAKRGDIGSTAQAYSNAYLGSAKFLGKSQSFINSDAITINPFLGFETIKVFLDDCLKNGKGIFILVKTSNSGSRDLQDLNISGKTISEVIAAWIEDNSKTLLGKCGLSGLGAVVGATHPAEMERLRKIMPNSIFLVPGFGAQGGTASQAVTGCLKLPNNAFPFGGSIINASRGIFGDIPKDCISWEQLKAIFETRVNKFNLDINQALLAL